MGKEKTRTQKQKESEKEKMKERLSELIYDYTENLSARDIHKADFEEKFADYLLKNGVIVTPCKVGDTVYKVMADKRIKRPYQYKVIGFWYSADASCNNAHLVRYVNGVFDSSMSIPFSDFGKTIFLTREEAEKALAGRSEGK